MRRSSLGLTAALAAAAAFPIAAHPQSAPPTPVASPNKLMDDVRFLADDRLEGRMTGSPGADAAAAYLARRFEEVGLRPGANGWFQEFTISANAPAAAHMHVGGLHGKNVIGVLPGRDPKLRNQVVVIGAHYDHLGRGGQFALDPDSTGTVHNGADDNASGTAALVEIARRLAFRRPARSVIVIAFSGEELGLLGSAAYVQDPLVPMSRTAAMVNLDMVGRLRNNRLIVYGTASAKEFPALLDSLNRDAGFELREIGDGYGPSDQTSFYAKKRPVLHLFTDLHEDYHRTTDDADKINADGLKRVADLATSLVRSLADRRTPLTWVEVPVAAHAAGQVQTPGYGAYLGTVPDLGGGEEGQGVRITSVRAGSPAEQAGLRADDVITKIGDMDVPDLQAMTDALRAHKPGDVVEIVVHRGDSTTTLRATLGTRGG
jgi:hypothetical protein